MNKMKIIILCFISIILLIVFYNVGYMLYLFYETKIMDITLMNNDNFYKKEIYNSNDGLAYVTKSYYYETHDKTLNDKYLLGEKRIDSVKNNISLTINKLNELDSDINIDFDYNIITSDDYYAIRSNNPLYFQYYDNTEHVLYEVYLYEK